jgi:hypothetical protein
MDSGSPLRSALPGMMVKYFVKGKVFNAVSAKETQRNAEESEQKSHAQT